MDKLAQGYDSPLPAVGSDIMAPLQGLSATSAHIGARTTRIRVPAQLVDERRACQVTLGSAD